MRDAETRAAEVEDWLDTISEERKALLLARIERATDDVYDDDLYDQTVCEVINAMYSQEIIDGLTEKGLAKAAYVDEEGAVYYAITDEGKEEFRAYCDADS